MDGELIAEIARELFDRDSYHGYDKATRDHQWMLGQTRYIRTVEHVVARALQALEGAWRPIDEHTPKDGAVIHVWAPGFEWPEAVRWEPFDPHTAAEVGEVGYWTYAEELLAEATDSCEPEQWTHWRPLPDPPRDEPIDGDRSRETKPILPNPIEGRGP